MRRPFHRPVEPEGRFGPVSILRTNENSPAVYCWDEEREHRSPLKRTAEMVATSYLFLSVVRFTDFVANALFPAVNCWAIFIRPLNADWTQNTFGEACCNDH
jgi:hypothetical protein